MTSNSDRTTPLPTCAMSSSSTLPTIDDLHSKARMSGVLHPGQCLMLDMRLHQGTTTLPGQTTTTGSPRKSGVTLVTPSTILHEQKTRCSRSILRNCTMVFQCNRFKSNLPDYRPLHHPTSAHPSPPSRCGSSWWRQWSERRRILFLISSVMLSTILFWTAIILWNMLSSSSRWSEGSTTATHPHLEEGGDARWYRDATFYEIFPASFLDTDSDGYGDFQGIIRQLDYIRDLGMTAIRLNSIFSALDYPLEFEHIIDLHSADPHLGRMGDFSQLVRECHRRGLRVVLDLNPTFTSDQHTWALHWQRGIPGYEHFYASANRSKEPPEMENSEGPPPEDWELTQRTFGGHYTLNWSNPFVQEEYQKALDHWIDAGIDGIYMKHLEKMHVLTPLDVPQILHQWRAALDRAPSEWSRDRPSSIKRVLIVSSKFASSLAEDLGQSTAWKDVLQHVDILDYPILVGNGAEMAEQVSGLRKVSSWPKGAPVPMWHLGSSDTFRMASRIEPRYHMAAFYLLMTLPGASSVFYGDEIGLKDSFDVFSGRVYRGGQLTPMQWTSDNSSGGFTDNMTNPWLPLNPEHFSTNVRNQQGRLKDFARTVTFRRTTLKNFRQRGQRVEVLDPNVIVLERTHHRHKSKRILLAANFGNMSEEKEFPEAYGSVRAVLTTSGPTRTRVRSRGFTISPGAAFLAEVTLLYYPSPTVLGE